MRWFGKRDDIEALPVTMTGVRLGDRLLAIGAADPALIALLARKTGLTGRVCVIDDDETRAARGATAIERDGALAEMVRAPWERLPLDQDCFDVAVARDVLFTMTADTRSRCLSEVFRVLRPGGRLIVIEPAPRRGITSLFSRTAIDPAYYERGGAVEALKSAGFVAVRLIADRDAVLYVEGAKRVDLHG